MADPRIADLVAEREAVAAAVRALNESQGRVSSEGIGVLVSLSISSIIAGVNAGIITQVSDTLSRVAGGWSQNFLSKPGLLEMHQKIGKKAQDTMVDNYRGKFGQGKGEPLFDRANAPGNFKRYARGAMERALRDPRNVIAGVDGIGFIDSGVMYNQAKQWYRLNFGAGYKGKGPLEGSIARKNFALTLFGDQVAQVSLENFKHAPNFSMPPGVWFGKYFLPAEYYQKSKDSKARHKDFLTRLSEQPEEYRRGIAARVKGPVEQKGVRLSGLEGPIPFGGRRVTSGIAQGAFINEGVASLVAQLGPAWENLLRDWMGYVEQAEIQAYVDLQESGQGLSVDTNTSGLQAVSAYNSRLIQPKRALSGTISSQQMRYILEQSERQSRREVSQIDKEFQKMIRSFKRRA